MLGLSGASRALGSLELLLRSGNDAWLADGVLTTTAGTALDRGAWISTDGRLYFSSSLARLLRGVGVGVAPWLESCSSSCLARIMGRRMRSLPAQHKVTHILFSDQFFPRYLFMQQHVFHQEKDQSFK